MSTMNEQEKPATTPVPVWRCKGENCNAWIREEMAPDGRPLCPLCQSPMIRSIKHLPKLMKKMPRKKKTEQDLL